MDRRRIELQLRAILLTYRVEHRRRDSLTMRQFRERAHALLDGLEAAVGPHPDLKAALDSAREELLNDDPVPKTQPKRDDPTKRTNDGDDDKVDPGVVPEDAPRRGTTVPMPNDTGTTNPPIGGWGEAPVQGEDDPGN